MDAMHEKGVKAFPAKTEGKGNQLMEPRMDKGVKVYELTAKEIQWEVEPGQTREGDGRTTARCPARRSACAKAIACGSMLTNKLPESTAMHFHGLELPNDQDGVPFITQPPVKPGETYTYEFTVPNAGSHMYHSHHNAAKQVGLGLLGAFIVEPKRPRAIEQGGRGLRDDPQRRRARLHAQRQGLPRDRADRRKARARRCASAS